MITRLLAYLLLLTPLAAEPKVVAFAGSTRKDSYNKKLVQEAAEIARKIGAAVTVIDLKDYPIPHYDADVEAQEGMPSSARRIRNLMIGSDAIIIASPQYNGSIPAVLKNILDWTSRDETGNPSRTAYQGKRFAIMSASPGKKGGAKALAHLRDVIEDCGGEVIFQQTSIPSAHQAFDAQGHLKSPQDKKQLQQEIEQLLSKQSISIQKG